MTRNVASINGELFYNFIQCQWLVNFPVRLVVAIWESIDRGSSGGGQWKAGLQACLTRLGDSGSFRNWGDLTDGLEDG